MKNMQSRDDMYSTPDNYIRNCFIFFGILGLFVPLGIWKAIELIMELL